MALDPGHVVQVPLLFISATLMLGLSVWVLLQGATRPLNRAFALPFFVIGLGDLSHALWHLAEPETLWRRMQVYLNLLVPFAALNFLLTYREQMTGARAPKWLRWLLLGLTVGAVVHYAFRHQDWLTEAGKALGPLKLVLAVGLLALSWVAVTLTWDFARLRDAARRRSLRAMAIGFSLFPWFVALVSLSVGDLISVAPFNRAIGALLLAPSLLLVALLAWAATRRSDPQRAYAARRFLLILTAPVVCAAIVAAVFYAGAPDRADQVLAVFVGIWTVSLPLVAAYALFRHRVFGIELRIKWTLKQGTIAGLFVAVFFVVSEGSQILFTQIRGNEWVGLVAASLLLFAIHPLQRMAERVATATMPETRPVTEMNRDERLEVYREHLLLAWADGTLSRKERSLLDHLRRRLDLTAHESVQLEADVLDR